ncbi:MAG: glycoside hydrolase family 2 TIM barrel-domain containing protein, partial [Bacteroidota bacterium]
EIVGKTDDSGKFSFRQKAKRLRRWSPDDPHRYTVAITGLADEVQDQIGFRTIETRGSDILLNGAPIFLKGICMHEESPLRQGRAHTREDAVQLLTWAKELGCNYVRLAHYPHNEHMIRTAEEMGILVWEEIPVYWTISWENPATYANAAAQLRTMIQRDRNRAATIIWSLANETPNSEARLRFLRNLAQEARNLDSTRLISAALEQVSDPTVPGQRTLQDPFAEVVDVLSFNQYIGWYDGLPDKCRTVRWKIPYDKPVLISEFGAGAKFGFHGPKTYRWTEEFQADLYTETLQMIDRIGQLRGFSPWILVDFRSPRRVLPGVQDEWNRKGLISDDGRKKAAFDVLKEYYERRK